MSAHTPGPWEVLEDIRTQRVGDMWSDDGYAEYLAGYNIAAEGEEIVGCEGIIPGANSYANALVMAAAPDMLAVLMDFVTNFAGMEDGDGNEAPELVAARAAISKATSHTPTSQEREPSATSHAATSPGPVNCNIRLRFQAEAGTPIGKSCARCGIGPCPFFHETGVSK